MIQPLRARFFMGILGLGVALSVLATFFTSCNDTGTSPYLPHISYKRSGIAAIKDSAIVPDILVSDGGAITSRYSISPVLPAGLVLDPATGIISGKAAALYSPTFHIVTATGPNGIASTRVNVCVGDSNHSCNINPPNVSYALNGGPGFLWTSPNVPLIPDTPGVPQYTDSGIVTGYAVMPALPAGLSLNPVTGIISGTPTDTMTAKRYQVIVTGPFGIDTEDVFIGTYPASFPFALLQKGKERFQNICSNCHGLNGEGERCPTLHPSDYLMADKHRPVRIQFLGLPNFVDTETVIQVNGVPYNGSMPHQGGNDSDIAGVLTFVRAFFNGAKDYISVQEVGHVRDSLVAVDTGHQYDIDTTHFGQ